MSTPRPLAGRVALVTGASRGIGRAIALPLAADGAAIRVNVVAAGLVDTDLGRKVARAGRGHPRPRREVHPGTVCSPEDVTSAVGFLVSPAAEQVTGQRVAVDAGGLRGPARRSAIALPRARLR